MGERVPKTWDQAFTGTRSHCRQPLSGRRRPAERGRTVPPQPPVTTVSAGRRSCCVDICVQMARSEITVNVPFAVDLMTIWGFSQILSQLNAQLFMFALLIICARATCLCYIIQCYLFG